MDADQPNSQQLNPAALTPAEAARLLSAAGGRPIPVEVVQAAIDAGAPVLADGRLNLVELMAWLEKDLAAHWRLADGQV
jgi:hypothetical protein